ncbi:MAG: hypothetical protein Greene071421_352 [Parcubacteria group bacterium Greene0714_21]|nr:MAG: hypothetical protein Greene041639_5 [Parcubacteria group bacterium Greene0416_39]TSC98336.1 MAG: hypothetical protein Greene101447_79 [Parcubacteria group bacterium Greene1014_47]TSD03986.1 MAG: hypothetical protein Greene071421_352 [Parcubacteria group bacterium Greene0714_21]
MTATNATVLKTVNEIEKNLQDLKVRLFFSSPSEQRKFGVYKEGTILRVLKQTRRQLWNEKYSKAL